MRQAYFDVKVVSPYARSYAKYIPDQLYRRAEKTKINEYGTRIKEVDRADFMPLVFTCAGGIGPKSHNLFKRLAELISERHGIPLSQVSGLIRV